MPEPEIIQQQRKLIHEFLAANARRTKAEADAQEQLENERAKAETFLAEQKHRSQQIEAKAQKHHEAERKAADDALAQAKGLATALLRQAQVALQKARDAVTGANLPESVSFSADTAPIPDSDSNPRFELQRSAERAEQAAEAVADSIHTWQARKVRAEARRRKLVDASVLVLAAIVISTLVISNQVQERHRQATATAVAQPTATAMAVAQATAMAVAQATATAVAQAQATAIADMPPNLQNLRSRLDMNFVYVPAGQFIMGSADGEGDGDEHPQHVVYLDAYWIGQTEVTNAQYQQCVAGGACDPAGCMNDDDLDKPDQPVVCVSWVDAKAFCEWAGLQLPTEAQWEKAARGTDGRIYPWGNEEPNCTKAQYWGCDGKTITVGSKPAGASPYGALDMAGNVWEWVADWYSEDYYANSPDRNPAGPESGDWRVLRGGSWNYYPVNVRAASRNGLLPGNRNDYVGFRCAAPSP